LNVGQRPLRAASRRCGPVDFSIAWRESADFWVQKKLSHNSYEKMWKELQNKELSETKKTHTHTPIAPLKSSLLTWIKLGKSKLIFGSVLAQKM